MDKKEEYINIVLSQIQCLELKRTIGQLLHEKIDEMLQNQCYSNVSEEKAVKKVLAKLGDPVKLGQDYEWVHIILALLN